jgi:hypothetical protein
MKKAIPIALIVLNLLAIFFYVKNASLAWAIPEEAGLNPAMAGPSMVWGLGALPILLAFIVVNGIWWSVVFAKHLEKWPVLSASVLWIIAVVVDFMHH